MSSGSQAVGRGRQHWGHVAFTSGPWSPPYLPLLPYDLQTVCVPSVQWLPMQGQQATWMGLGWECPPPPHHRLGLEEL